MKTDVKIVDNVFVKMNYIPHIGESIKGHSHTFDHISILASGAVKMIHDKGEQDFTAPHLIVIPKDTKHEFVATENATLLCCVHAIRDGEGVNDVADQDISSEQALELLQKNPIVNGINE